MDRAHDFLITHVTQYVCDRYRERERDRDRDRERERGGGGGGERKRIRALTFEVFCSWKAKVA